MKHDGKYVIAVHGADMTFEVRVTYAWIQPIEQSFWEPADGGSDISKIELFDPHDDLYKSLDDWPSPLLRAINDNLTREHSQHYDEEN